MPNLKDRPYVGTWKLGDRSLVQHTPDALVYINGALSVPGCKSCEGRIDIQKFITEVSVEGGVEPNGASASFTLSVPVHSTDAFARDAKFLLHPGLEVHVYHRGYFPATGLFSNLGNAQSDGTVSEQTTTSTVKNTVTKSGSSGGTKAKYSKDAADFDPDAVPDAQKKKWKSKFSRLAHYANSTKTDQRYQNSLVVGGAGEVIEQYWRQKFPNAKVVVTSFGRKDGDNGNHSNGAAIDFKVQTNQRGAGTYVPALQVWASLKKLGAAGRIPKGAAGLYLNIEPGSSTGTKPEQAGPGAHSNYAPGSSSSVHYDFRGSYGFRPNTTVEQWVWTDKDGDGKDEAKSYAKGLKSLRDSGRGEIADYITNGGWKKDPYLPDVGSGVPNLLQVTGQSSGFSQGSPTTGTTTTKVTKGSVVLDADFSPSIIDRLGLGGLGIEDVISYPYYPTFHGIVTQVSHSWSGGMQTISVQCASMMHFWQYHKVITQGAMGSTTKVKKAGKTYIDGHRFTGQHPYQIIGTLHRMVFGDAAGSVGSFDHVSNAAGVQSSFGGARYNFTAITKEYWKRRFARTAVNLRMHAVSGALYSTLQSAYMSETSSNRLMKNFRNAFKGTIGTKVTAGTASLDLANPRALRGTLFAMSPLSGGRRHIRPAAVKAASKRQFGLNILEMFAFHKQLGNIANFGMFDAAYMSKLDIAQKVMEITGFEFYQDMDGDFVFKPPMWNLDTSGSRTYRIEDIDIINVSFEEKEPQCTYVVVKQGMTDASGLSTGTDEVTNKVAIYVDHRLVAKFGYRPFEFQTTYMKDTVGMYYMAMARLDVLNVPTHSASVTIPIRPELRPGYPVFIPYLDCFYYIQSMSHSFSIGGQCTTTLQLVAKRAKFFAPGEPGGFGIDAIRFTGDGYPEKPLEVIGPDGAPRLSGFPNVVMALDPNQVNPLWYPAGPRLDKLDSEEDVYNLLEFASGSGVGLLGLDENSNFILRSDSDSMLGAVEIVINVENGTVTNKQTGQSFGTFAQLAADLSKAQKKLEKITSNDWRQTVKSERDSAGQALSKLNGNIKALKATPKSPERDAELAKLEAKRLAAEKKYASWTSVRSPVDALIAQNADSTPVLGLLRAREVLQRQFGLALDHESARQLDLIQMDQLLASRKANFTSDTVVGEYRYYSASHPKPEHQGAPYLNFTAPPSGGMTTEKTPLPLGDDFQNVPVKGYLAATTSTRAEAELVEGHIPTRGIALDIPRYGAANLQGSSSYGTVVPTSEILTVSFGTHSVTMGRPIAKSWNILASKGTPSALGSAFAKRITKAELGDAEGSDTPEERWGKEWEKALEEVMRSYNDALKANGLEYVVSISGTPPGDDPNSVTIQGVTIEAGWQTSFEVWRQQSPRRFASKEGDVDKVVKLWEKKLAASFESAVSVFIQQVRTEILDAAHKVAEESDDDEGLDLAFQMSTDFMASVSSKFGIPFSQGSLARTVQVTGSKKVKVWSPVFPVSDAQGYEVVGAFQYGRGLRTDDDSWQSLRQQDPFSVLDPKTAADIINTVVHADHSGKAKKGVVVDVERELPGGTVVTESKTLKGNAAKTALEKKALNTLRKKYSDADLIDMGILKKVSANRYVMDLANIIANRNDTIHKLPINNAGLSLADLSLKQDGKICECRAAEASVRIEAFGNEDFLSFSGSEASGFSPRSFADTSYKWLQQQAHLASSSHRVQQKTLRGTALEPPNNSKFMSLNDLKKGLSDSFSAPIEAATKRFEETKEQWGRFEDEAKRRFRQAKQDVAAEFDGNPDTNAGDPLPEDRED